MFCNISCENGCDFEMLDKKGFVFSFFFFLKRDLKFGCRGETKSRFNERQLCLLLFPPIVKAINHSSSVVTDNKSTDRAIVV